MPLSSSSIHGAASPSNWWVSSFSPFSSSFWVCVFLPSITSFSWYFIKASDSTNLLPIQAARRPLYSSIASPTFSRTLVPIPLPLSFPEKFSQPDIVQPLTEFLPPVANLALSLPKLALVHSRTLVVQTNLWSTCKLIPSHGVANADVFFSQVWKFSHSSWWPVSSPPSYFLRPRAGLSKSFLTKTKMNLWGERLDIPLSRNQPWHLLIL